MRTRRTALGGLAALAVVALVGVWPAQAASTPTTVLNSPADGVTWTGGSTTDFHVSGRSTTPLGPNANVSSVRATFSPTDHNTHAPYPGQQTWTDTNTGRDFDFTIFPDINGKYRLNVVAHGTAACTLFCQDADGPGIVRNITVAVKPAPPTGAKSSITDGGVATAEWSANNTEGDLLGYYIDRQAPGASAYSCFAAVAVDPKHPSSYKITDDIHDQPSGDYRYRVRAIRALDTDSKFGTCADPGPGLSSAASTSTKVTWVNPTAPTTTTTTPGGGGGGGGGNGSTTTTRPKSTTGIPAASGTSTNFPPRTPNLAALGSLGGVNNLARTPTLPNENDAGGFNELLPFQGGSNPVDSGTAAAQTPLNGADSSNGQTNTLLFIAAGLLATVLSMHVLWLKAQVDRTPLEPLAPQDMALL